MNHVMKALDSASSLVYSSQDVATLKWLRSHVSRIRDALQARVDGLNVELEELESDGSNVAVQMARLAELRGDLVLVPLQVWSAMDLIRILDAKLPVLERQVHPLTASLHPVFQDALSPLLTALPKAA